MQQIPTIGRIVHYVAYGTPGGEFPAGAHRAAIITEFPAQSAEDPGSPFVGLCIFNPTGLYFSRDVGYSEDYVPGTWHWPEYVTVPKPST